MNDSNNNPLIPGALYACLLKDIDFNGDEFEEYGSLVRYGSDGTLYCVDFDGDESTSPVFDELVYQAANIDERYIFEG